MVAARVTVGFRDYETHRTRVLALRGRNGVMRRDSQYSCGFQKAPGPHIPKNIPKIMGL